MREIVGDAYAYALQYLGQGKIFDFIIPSLKGMDFDQLAVSVTDIGGNTYSAGNSGTFFTMQSISKTILMAAALEDSGYDAFFANIGMEPTGDTFNASRRLETESPVPSNPLINAGALRAISFVKGSTVEERFSRILEKTRLVMGDGDLDYDKEAADAEFEVADRNRALIALMRAGNAFEKNGEDNLAVHCMISSIMVTSEHVSFWGAVLANRGVCPRSGKQLVDPKFVSVIRAVMSACGMYDRSGETAVRVGIPSKCGSGGGIMSSAAGKMGIGVYSPGLDDKGVSICGFAALEYISNRLGLSMF